MYIYKVCNNISKKHLKTISVTRMLPSHWFLKNGGHLGLHLGFLKTSQVYALAGSLINFRLCRTFWYMILFVRFHGGVPLWNRHLFSWLSPYHMYPCYRLSSSPASPQLSCSSCVPCHSSISPTRVSPTSSSPRWSRAATTTQPTLTSLSRSCLAVYSPTF